MSNKLYIVRIEYHYDGSQDLLYTLDETTARGFYAGYCEQVKAAEAESSYVSSQTDLELLCVPLDSALTYNDGQTVIHKTWREIVGHSGIKRK